MSAASHTTGTPGDGRPAAAVVVGLVLAFAPACSAGSDHSAAHHSPFGPHSDSGAGCNGRGDDLEDLTITSEIPDSGTRLELALMEATPVPPVVGNSSWLFGLTLDGEAVTGMAEAMTLVPFMPDHGHGTPTPVSVTEEAPGHYRFEPVHMRMAGYWEHTIIIEDDDLEAEMEFGVCIE